MRPSLAPLIAVAAVLVVAAPATGKGRPERFRTPSGQVVCAYAAGKQSLIRCDLLFLDHRAALLQSGGRPRVTPFTAPVGNLHARVLRYGTSRAFGRFTCTSRTTGLTCRDRRSGHGFEVSRQRQRLF